MKPEERIETYLREAAKKAGGKAFKFVSPGNDGVPDRLIVLPGGRIAFVECKAPGKEPTPLQEAVHAALRRLGAQVFVVDSKQKIDHAIQSLSVPDVRHPENH